VKDIAFEVNFVAGNSNKSPKLGLERKISGTLNLFTLVSRAQATIVPMKPWLACQIENMPNHKNDIIQSVGQRLQSKVFSK
jgi:hypothetical protein